MTKKATKLNLDAYTNEQLRAELERREKQVPLVPEPRSATGINLVDLNKMRAACVYYMDEVIGGHPDPEEHYIFEAAMEAIYGEEIWPALRVIYK